jgi:hypothetical protein
MRALTVQQPWAWAIIHGGKDTENRSGFPMWRRAAGQTIAIHAGLRISERGLLDRRVLAVTPALRPLHTGAIIGTVRVVAVHQALADCCQPWGEASFVEHGGRRRVEIVHLVLADPRPLAAPVACRGRLGLWTVPDELLEAVTADA